MNLAELFSRRDVLQKATYSAIALREILSRNSAPQDNRQPIEMRQGVPTRIPENYTCAGDNILMLPGGDDIKLADSDNRTALLSVTTEPVTLVNRFGDVVCEPIFSANDIAARAAREQEECVYTCTVKVIYVPGQRQEEF